PVERRRGRALAMAAVGRVDPGTAMDEAMVDEMAVKRDLAADVHWRVRWDIRLAVAFAIPLTAANRGVGMGSERAAADRRAGAKYVSAAAKSAAVVTTSTARATPAPSTTGVRGES